MLSINRDYYKYYDINIVVSLTNYKNYIYFYSMKL